MPAAALTRKTFKTQWYSLRGPFNPIAPRHWYSWLSDSGSLTKRLVKLSHGHLRVRVVRQVWAQPTASEAKALKMKPRQYALIREVELIGQSQVWVYARSIIPAATLTGRQRQLKQLGSRSLGSMLFADPSMTRTPLQISQLTLSQGQQAWARRSIFSLANKPLLVCEVFLPELQQVHSQP